MDDTFTAHETTRKKRRWGCTCGCLVFLIVVICGAIGLLYYAFKPVSALAPERYLTPDADGFLVLRIRPDDPGVWGLVDSSLKNVEKHQKQNVPENEQKAVSAMITFVRTFLGQFVHPAALVYFVYDPATGQQSSAGVVQLRNLTSWLFVKMLAGAFESRPYEAVEGTVLYKTNPQDESTSQPIIGVSRKSIVFGSSGAAVKGILRPSPAVGRPSQNALRLQEFVDSTSVQGAESDPDIGGVFINENGYFEYLLKWLEKHADAPGLTDQFLQLLAAQKLKLSDVLAFTLSGDVVTPDTGTLQITLFARSTDTSKRLTEIFRNLLARLVAQPGADKYVKSHEVKPQGTNVLMTLEFAGLTKLSSQYTAPAAAQATPTPGPTVTDSRPPATQ